MDGPIIAAGLVHEWINAMMPDRCSVLEHSLKRYKSVEAVLVEHAIFSCFKQEFSYRKQIARQLRTQYVEGI